MQITQATNFALCTFEVRARSDWGHGPYAFVLPKTQEQGQVLHEFQVDIDADTDTELLIRNIKERVRKRFAEDIKRALVPERGIQTIDENWKALLGEEKGQAPAKLAAMIRTDLLAEGFRGWEPEKDMRLKTAIFIGGVDAPPLTFFWHFQIFVEDPHWFRKLIALAALHRPGALVPALPARGMSPETDTVLARLNAMSREHKLRGENKLLADALLLSTRFGCIADDFKRPRTEDSFISNAEWSTLRSQITDYSSKTGYEPLDKYSLLRYLRLKTRAEGKDDGPRWYSREGREWAVGTLERLKQRVDREMCGRDEGCMQTATLSGYNALAMLRIITAGDYGEEGAERLIERVLRSAAPGLAFDIAQPLVVFPEQGSN